MSEAKSFMAFLNAFIIWSMVLNTSTVPWVMHRFKMDMLVSETYTEHLLHNTWTSLLNTFMPVYEWLSSACFSQVSSKDWKNTPKSRTALWSKRSFAEIRFPQHSNIFISGPAGKKTSLAIATAMRPIWQDEQACKECRQCYSLLWSRNWL